MPRDEGLTISGGKAQFFATSHAGLCQLSEAAIGKILKSALESG
jgi:hypothetical protein